MYSDGLTEIAEKAARGSLFLFIGNTSATVILAVGSIIIARLLGPASYGLYILTMLTPLLLASLADAGMNSALVRYLAKYKAEGDYRRISRMIKLGFLLKLVTSVVAFLVCYGGAELIAVTVLNRAELAPFVRLASFLVIFQTVLDVANSSFIGLDLMQYSASMQILQSILKSGLAPALILVGFGITGAISGYVLSAVVAAVIGVIILARCARFTGRMNGSSSVELTGVLRYSLPMYLTMILVVFLMQYQNIVLAHFATDIQIGNFNAASNFNSLMMILIYPISTAMFPMFSKMHPEKQRSELVRAFVLAVKYASLVLIPASIAVMLFSQDLVRVTYGRGYVLAPQYLMILSTLYLLTGLGYFVLGSFLPGVSETGTFLRMGVLTLTIYLPLGAAFAWFGGPLGLIAALILSNAASTLYGVRKASVRFGARPDLKASARILLAALVAAIPAIALNWLDTAGIGIVNLVLGGLLYLATYLTVAPILGAVDRLDIDNLKIILDKIPAASVLAKYVLRYEMWIFSVVGRTNGTDDYVEANVN
jgi:O-antigen/teichoic acid export membrane protein